jgi:NAD(P)-dependent dehydrogenase (short-subunit alcohol dehydrogenase family)
MAMTARLEGRTALVTGGTRGIGAAIAERLIADGAAVVVTGTRADGSGPAGSEFRVADFDDLAATEQFASEAAELAPDILVNSAGMNKIAPFAEIDPADFDRIQRVNVRAPFLLCRAVVPAMCERGWGRIVNIASIWGLLSREQRGSYSASKFALDGMTAALAAEVARDGVLANCVSPGFIDTELTRTVLGEDGIAELTAQVPARRLGSPAEVAALVAWLVGPENTYVSGQNVVIDGGFSRT